MKEDAMQLVILSRSVSDQINTTGGMILSVNSLKNLEKIEQIAKKLRANLKDKWLARFGCLWSPFIIGLN